jgi:hypothetical protein
MDGTGERLQPNGSSQTAPAWLDKDGWNAAELGKDDAVGGYRPQWK